MTDDKMPKPVFSHGPWLLEETGQRFTGDQLDAAAFAKYRAALAAQAEKHAAEIEALRCVLHEIAEEWAGAECGEPVHAQEAYAIGLAKRMYLLAAAALRPNVATGPSLGAAIDAAIATRAGGGNV